MPPYYFAYGSNMNLKQMQKRCPNAKFITVGKLNGHKFVYDGFSKRRNGPVANIIESESDFVLGVIFLVDEQDEKNLDRFEGYPKTYDKKFCKVDGEDGSVYNVFLYFRKPLQIGTPQEDYRNIVIEGAKDIGLPQEYISKYLIT